MTDRSEQVVEEVERQADRRPPSKKLAPLRALGPFLKPYGGMTSAEDRATIIRFLETAGN